MMAPRTTAIDLVLVGQALRSLIASLGASIALEDGATGECHILPIEAVSEPGGLLPVFIAAADAIWREAAQQSFQCDLRADSDALFGYRITGVRSGMRWPPKTGQVAKRDLRP